MYRQENPDLQFFIGLEGFQYSAPFDPSMMVYFRKRLPKSVVNNCNERIVRHGLNLFRASETEDHDQDDSQGGAGVCDPEQKLSQRRQQITRAHCLSMQPAHPSVFVISPIFH